ncbi:MAG: hypothetical protein GXP25_00125 [Planctomycetes bacterium]|nr:hypothetical protein [Planctomycetota bacterium]
MSSIKPEKTLVVTSAKPMPAEELMTRMESDDGSKWLRKIYGDDEELIKDRRQACLRVLRTFVRRYGTGRNVILVRSPSRINVMGVHAEHRRGEVNYVAHRREILMVAEPRTDDTVVLGNTSRSFPKRTFNISEERKRSRHKDWLKYIDSPGVSKVVQENRGDWVNYVKSGVLRLQFFCLRKRLKGMNLMIEGDIPRSVGLSSSSALVVASAMATTYLNRLRVTAGELVELCGEGEWYVGTRGGAGDHAAMIMGRRGYIAHLRFFPFQLLQYVPLPKTHSIVICNSLRQAKKSTAELSAYNETIAAYGTVLMLIKDILAKDFGFKRTWLDRHIKHLGDFNLDKRRFPEVLLYEILKRMPQRITREELLERLPRKRDALRRMFRTHDKPRDGYRARAVAMFGLSEIARGAACVRPLKDRDYKLFGKLMYISHDGDRIVRYVRGRKVPWDNETTQVTDAYLDGLINKRKSRSKRTRQGAQLMLQPGGYRCSSEELDHLVDIAASVKGVVGAGLTGAGFGGCVLVLVKNSSAKSFLSAVRRRYYEARGFPFGAEVCTSVAGACAVEI